MRPTPATPRSRPDAQGVSVGGSQVFGTTFARVLGITQFTASAVATAVSGALTGGIFMPVVFPVSMAQCDGSGNTVVVDEPWRLSNPDPTDPTAHPIGQEYIVPLCKTGGGSFMILDLDPNKNCAEEVTDPSSIQFNDFPVDIPTDNGNDCAKKIEQAVQDAQLQGSVVMIPICDGQCVTIGAGSNGYLSRHPDRGVLSRLPVRLEQRPNNSACCADDLSHVRHEHRQHRRRQRQLELHGRLVRPLRDVRPGRERQPQQRRGRRGPAHPVTRRLARGHG